MEKIHEPEVVIKSKKELGQPNTIRSLCEEFGRLNIKGETVLVHSSLSKMGWVCGGPQAVVMALLEAVGMKKHLKKEKSEASRASKRHETREQGTNVSVDSSTGNFPTRRSMRTKN